MKLNNKKRVFAWLIVILVALPSFAIAGDKGVGKGNGLGSDNNNGVGKGKGLGKDNNRRVGKGLGGDNNKGVRYYLSLGTSLAVGVQPDISGKNQLTDEGYADQLFDQIGPVFKKIGSPYRKIKLVKLGCPGETTESMINGGKCEYAEGSQLAEAVEFLRTHKNKVALVTIDVGVNDVLPCVDGPTLSIKTGCLQSAFMDIQINLNLILSALNDNARVRTRIVGMNYYNTLLASWLFQTEQAQDFSVFSAIVATEFNTILTSTYSGLGIPVADVAGAYFSNNFDNSIGQRPLNVATLCEYTYMCGGLANIHANPVGYRVIADAFVDVLAPEVAID